MQPLILISLFVRWLFRLALIASLLMQGAFLVAPPATVDLPPASLEGGLPAPGSGRVGPPRMAFRPPARATRAVELVPPGLPARTVPRAPAGRAARSAPLEPATGGAVRFAGTPLTVVVEPGTFARPVSLEVRALPPPARGSRGGGPEPSLFRFELERVALDGGPPPAFARPVRLVLDLRQRLSPARPAGRFYLAHADPGNAGVWREAPLQVHDPTGLISAAVTHFSSWDAGQRPVAWNPLWTPPAVDAFSGAATYQVPLEAPPGRAGLEPDLRLSYNSRSLDGAIFDLDEGDVATGWSLAETAILREGAEIIYQGVQPVLKHPDRFRLLLDGVGYQLVPAGDALGDQVRYFARDAPGLRITRLYDESAPNYEKLFWLIDGPDGRRVRLGYTPEAEEYQTTGSIFTLLIEGHRGLDTGSETDRSNRTSSALAWHVDTVTDAFGNQLLYDYRAKETFDEVNNVVDGATYQATVWTLKNRLLSIAYNFPDRITDLPAGPHVGRLASQPATRLTFRAAHDDQPEQAIDPISSIYFFHGPGSTAPGGLPTTEFRLGGETLSLESTGCYDDDRGEWRRTRSRALVEIRRFSGTNADPADDDPGFALPPTTFSYVHLPHFHKNGGGCFIYPYLLAVNNGYGASVTFDYESDLRSVGDYVRYGSLWYSYPLIGYSHFVASVRSDDGRSGEQVTTYTYETPCYDQWRDPPDGAVLCHDAAETAEVGPLVGFGSSIMTVADPAGAVVQAQETTFSLESWSTVGRPLQERRYDGAGHLLQITTTTYDSRPHGPAFFVYARAIETTDYDPDPARPYSLTTRRELGYEEALQGGAQFGNQTTVHDYGDVSTPVDDRTVLRRFIPRVEPAPGRWIVDRVAVERQYAGIVSPSAFDSAPPLRETFTSYDGAPRGTPPHQGAISRVETGLTGAPLGGGTNGLIATTTTVDAFGNRLTTTDGRGAVTRTLYDPDYALYPLAVRQNDGGSPVLETTFAVYGFAGEALDGFQSQPGLLKRATGPDGTLTLYEYDPFGRLHASYDRPDQQGASANPWDGDPIVRYRYWDNGWNHPVTYLAPAAGEPFMIVAKRRPASFNAATTGYELAEISFFDGLGRPIQQRTTDVAVAGREGRRDRYVHLAYDALGETACRSVPVDLSGYAERGLVWPDSSFVSTACPSMAHTATERDAMGRTLVERAPDGTETTYAYGITPWYEANGVTRLHRVQQTDPNGHVTNRFYDSRGQLALIREFTGDGSDGAPYAPLADTRFRTDLLGNLLYVRQSAPSNDEPVEALAAINMGYDVLGRRVTLDDPDTGAWSFAYDGAGNLVRRVDARGLVTCRAYDAFNRLIGRAQDLSPSSPCPSPLPTSGPAHLATYVYYAAGGGQAGRLRQISWGEAPEENHELFAYDARGRLTHHARTIAGQEFSLTYAEYDALDRPRRIDQPDGSLTALGYDREGAESLALGNLPIVVALHYNAQDQLADVVLGNGQTTSLSYEGVAGPDGGGSFRLGRLQSGSQLDISLTYDAAGNVVSLLDNVAGNLQSFDYDEQNRLIAAAAPALPGEPTSAYELTFAYDLLGNPVAGDAGALAYADPAHVHAVTHVEGARRYGYDANGNMITRQDAGGSYVQNFDIDNRLVLLEKEGDGAVTFAYDASGRRVRTVYPDGRVVLRPFPHYEEEHAPLPPPPAPTPTPPPAPTPTPPPDSCLEGVAAPGVEASGCEPPGGSGVVNQPGATRVVRRLTLELGGQTVALAVSVADEPNAPENGLAFLHGDHLGSVSARSDEAGAPTAGSAARYLPFGGWRLQPTSNVDARGFTGHRHLNRQENDLGLIDLGARFYLPDVGRFVSADTVVPAQGDPQALNRYGYARNNPLALLDPSGHCWGAFSFVRSWNVTVGERSLGMGQNCQNLDQALTIVSHPDATAEQRVVAGAFVGAWIGAAASGAAGSGMLACGAVAPCAAAARGALGVGATAGSAAAADGDPTNELRAAREAFARAQFHADPRLPAGSGMTDSLGRITISPRGTMLDQMQALFHEQVHAFLTPRGPLQATRARFSLWSYHHSHLLRYVEEAIAETFAQWRTGGSLVQGLAFPVANGYVNPAIVVFEGTFVGGAAVGGYVGIKALFD